MRRTLFFAAILAAFFVSPLARAQQQPAPPDNTPNADAGGPGGDTGAVALPKKNPNEAPPPPPAPVIKNPEGMGQVSLRVDVPLVNVDVSVLSDKTHQFISGLKQGNFRVYEDGVEQKVADFQKIQAPITAVMVLEFAATNYNFIYDMRSAASAFARDLKPNDYVAVVTYDLHTHILTDFTQDKRRVYEALNTLTVPMFSDRNMFDALYETLDRISSIEGRKYIILIGSGRDTFSKVNLDKILKKIKSTPDVTIFSIGTGQFAREMAFAGHPNAGIREMDYLQADNQMKTFAQMTGGQSFFPMFEGAMPEIFKQINDTIRSAYVLSYHPTNAKMDGSFRKLKVDLVDGEGKPLKMQDEKGKTVKYEIIARDGYRAKQQVE